MMHKLRILVEPRRCLIQKKNWEIDLSCVLMCGAQACNSSFVLFPAHWAHHCTSLARQQSPVPLDIVYGCSANSAACPSLGHQQLPACHSQWQWSAIHASAQWGAAGPGKQRMNGMSTKLKSFITRVKYSRIATFFVTSFIWIFDSSRKENCMQWEWWH